MRPAPTIGLLTAQRELGVQTLSGTLWHATAALGRECGRVTPLGPSRPLVFHAAHLAAAISRRMTPRHKLDEWHEPLVARSYGRVFSRRVRATRPDWIFAPFASAELSYLNTNRPVVYLSDTTFRAMLGYYPEFTGLSRHVVRGADRLEQRAIARADVACFASAWAARSAIEDYGAAPEKVHVTPLGANFAVVPDAESVSYTRGDGPVRLLFAGVDWHRKGGAIAFDAMLELRRRGIDAQLTVLGCSPPTPCRHTAVTVLGFLNKADPRDAARIQEAFRTADFLMVPTRAECYGLVFVEALAYAVPSIATDTGGVSSAVTDGETGVLLPLDADGGDYAAVVQRLLDQPELYSAMRRAARRDFDERCNWTTWARRVGALVSPLLSQSGKEREP